MEKTTVHRIDEIECLRAVAIIFTLIHHAVYFLIVRPNEFATQIYRNFTFWGGVDLFFVISGFVIMRDINRRFAQGVQLSYFRNAGAFWMRRAWRILPSAWLWVVLYLLATLYFNESKNAFGFFEINLKDSLAAVFQYANIHQLDCSVTTCGPNGVYWSLSLEEQFYILLPLVIFVSGRFLAPLLSLILAIQFFIPRPVWSLAWAIRTDTFIWGVLLALVFEHPMIQKIEPKFLKHKILRWVSIGFLIAAMAFVPAHFGQLPLATSLLGVVCLLLVFIASYGNGYLMVDGHIRKIFVWLGSRSYSIYLIHIIAYRFTIEVFLRALPGDHRFTDEDSIYFLLVAIPLVLILSELNFRIVEQPLRKIGRRLSDKILTNKVSV